MAGPERVRWRGRSGREYDYYIFPVDARWNPVDGNYIFARLTGQKWHVLSIGETGNLQNRLGPHHERWGCAKRHGMTHIHAHVSVSSEIIRRREEADLREMYHPPCDA